MAIGLALDVDEVRHDKFAHAVLNVVHAGLLTHARVWIFLLRRWSKRQGGGRRVTASTRCGTTRQQGPCGPDRIVSSIRDLNSGTAM